VGRGFYNLKPYERSIFKQEVKGCTLLEANTKHLKITFIGTDGKELHSSALEK